MKTVLELRKLRPGYAMAVLLVLYALNYIVAPVLVGEARLESLFRPHLNQKFDPTVWQKSELIDDGKHGKDSPSYGRRYEMVDDLLASHISLGMKGEEVRASLGNPDGIVDRKSIMALPDLYGFHQRRPAKEILESPDNVAWWSYHLGYQRQYPARSVWFPAAFFNFDRWMLLIKMKNGTVCELKIGF